MFKSKFSLSSSTVLAVIVSCCTAYYMLLHENFMHSSISCIISFSHNLAHRQHIIVLGLLPIYIAVMIFGAALLGIYTVNRLEFLRTRTISSEE